MSLKRIVIILTITALVVPFILVTSLFPFMRFGMFAEPVSHLEQKESFLILKNDAAFSGDELHLDPNTLHYLTRNYVYRDQSNLLLQKLSRCSNGTATWELYHLNAKADTTLLATHRAN